MTNRVKGLELTDTVTEELWTEVPNTAQQAMIKTISKKKETARRQNGYLRGLYE